MNDALEEIRMKIKGLILDPDSQMPIVVLQDTEGENLLPIWIGVFEANAIAMSIETIETPRPMTHDLLSSMILELGGEVQRIVISDLRDSTFYALIHLEHEGEVMELDARPSDAIALALKAGAPFFVTRQVLEKAKIDDRLSKLNEEDRLKKWLEEVDPDDLGKYEM